MRRPRDLALQTGLYMAAAISGVAAAYILKEYVFHFWDSWSRDRSIRTDSTAGRGRVDHGKNDDLETKRGSRTDPTTKSVRLDSKDLQTQSPTRTTDSPSLHLNYDPTILTSPPLPSDPAVVISRGETHGEPVLTQTRTQALPPLQTHSLPPPLPNPQLTLSGAHLVLPSTRSSSLSMSHSWSLVGRASEDESVTEEHDGDADALQVNSPISESLVEILSPAPTQEISRRRSVRAHDLFAASHISFSELGSLVSTDSQSN